MTMEHPDYGRRHHVVYPCDETNDAGDPVRTWDIFRRGRSVGGGFATRREAQSHARAMDRRELERLPLGLDRPVDEHIDRAVRDVLAGR